MSYNVESASPEPTFAQNGDDERSPKRRRVETTHGSSHVKTTNTRRKTACQSCRMRKVKCDAIRPVCGICKASDAVCKYTDPLPEKLTIDTATELLSKKLDKIQHDLERVHNHAHPSPVAVNNETRIDRRQERHFNPDLPRQPSNLYTNEPSKDFLAIPAARTTADTVLTWPVYEGKYEANALISILYSPLSGAPGNDLTPGSDSFVVPGGLMPLNEESIPLLVDIFLENVHTKNPVLDVEQLVKQSRIIAGNGIGWDAWSCLVLLASALGTIAKPFDAAVNVARTSIEDVIETTWITDAPTTPRELQQAESYFLLACRRLGCLKHSILGSQCYFFAGVYLMYTLRPLLSWQYFTQASIIYQLHMKSTHRLATDISLLGQIPVDDSDTPDQKQRRLEESMYWSCFKSESEFRVELPLPQSELATYYHPQMFPSPPSPAGVDHDHDAIEELETGDIRSTVPNGLVKISSYDSETADLRQHAKKLCNEEESWYYYLTEIALRRIGNRIINTFFGQDPTAWLNIKPWLSIALEFDTQVSAWSAHLPAAMQHWETNYTIRAPNHAPFPDGTGNHVSRELSWATDNRLLEMRSWLYQPFLYYLIHQTSSKIQTATSHNTVSATNDTLLAPSLESFVESVFLQGEQLDAEDISSLYAFIQSGIECNLKILDVRSLRHRHHGLWYDMRSLMCASLILLGIVKSGHEAWLPGGAEILWGYDTPANPSHGISGKIGHIVDEFDYWKDESPDLRRHREVLEDVTRTVRSGWREQHE